MVAIRVVGSRFTSLLEQISRAGLKEDEADLSVQGRRLLMKIDFNTLLEKYKENDKM